MNMNGRLILLAVAGISIGLIGATIARETPTGQPASASAGRGAAQLTYPPRLSGLSATRFAVSETGDLWIPVVQATGDNVLHRYNPGTDQLEQFALPSHPGGGFFVGIDFDPAGVVWLAWDQVLVSFDPTTRHARTFTLPTSSAFAVPNIQGNWVRALAVDSVGRIWLSRSNAASLVEFDPASSSFVEHGTELFGVPDRIHVAPDGLLWLTLARDANNEEFTSAAVFDSKTADLIRVTERASDIAFDTAGNVLIADNVQGPARLGPDRSVSSRFRGPFQPSSTDLLRASAEGKIFVANRSTGALVEFDPSTSKWSIYRLRSRIQTVRGPTNYSGPPEREVLPQVTDLHFDPQGRLWILVANNREFAVLQ